MIYDLKIKKRTIMIYDIEMNMPCMYIIYIYMVYIRFNTYYHIHIYIYAPGSMNDMQPTTPMNTSAARAAFRGIERAQILQC